MIPPLVPRVLATTNHVPHFQADSLEAYQRTFESDLMLRGSAWLLEETRQSIMVIWSCSSPVTPCATNQLCTTTFNINHHGDESGDTCDNCTIFGFYTDNGATNKSCPHIGMRAKVLMVLQGNGDMRDGPFERFLRSSFSNTQQITRISRSQHKAQYFVLCNKLHAQQHNLSARHAVVTVELSIPSLEVLMMCKNTQCRRRTDKKKSKNPEDFCPHFEVLFRNTRYKAELSDITGDTMCSSDDDESIVSESNMGVPLDHNMFLQTDTDQIESEFSCKPSRNLEFTTDLICRPRRMEDFSDVH